jgi:hypothetical protein
MVSFVFKLILQPTYQKAKVKVISSTQAFDLFTDYLQGYHSASGTVSSYVFKFCPIKVLSMFVASIGNLTCTMADIKLILSVA